MKQHESMGRLLHAIEFLEILLLVFLRMLKSETQFFGFFFFFSSMENTHTTKSILAAAAIKKKVNIKK